MEIRYKDYNIIPEGSHYNLTRDTKNKDKVTGKTIVKVIGYGFSFIGALKRIVKEELNDKSVTVTINQYIELFNKEFIKIKEYVKEVE